MQPAAKEIRKRLMDVGYKNVCVSIYGYILNIRFKPKKVPGVVQGYVSRDEYRAFLTAAFGSEYADECSPTSWDDIWRNSPAFVSSPRLNVHRPFHSLHLHTAEALLGWRKREWYCACGERHNTRDAMIHCMTTH